jgi:hypothetical protein
MATGSDQKHGDSRRLSTTQARQAVAFGSVRYVLAIGLALVIIAFALIYVFHT